MKSTPEIFYDGWLLQKAGYGIAQHAHRLLALLMRSPLADRIRVVTPSGMATPTGCSVLELGTLPPWPGLFWEVAWYARLSAFVRAQQTTNLLILPSPGMLFGYPSKTLVICHDLIHRKFKNYLGRWGYRKWLFTRRDRHLADASRLISDSAHTADELRCFMGRKTPPLTTIPLWAPAEFRADIPVEQRDAVRRRYDLPPRYWLYVGGYDYRKNVGFLIQAYAQARRTGACPALVLAGTIPRRKGSTVCDVSGELQRSGLDSPDRVLPGFVENDDLPALYAGAELLVYPSRAEGFGLPPVEAMACGCPAIVADQTSLPEVVTDPEYRFKLDGITNLAGILSNARDRRLPMNPGFDRKAFNEDRALRDYLDVVSALIGE
jgi:glycosyltransferase involved in cell wall biosynthesis